MIQIVIITGLYFVLKKRRLIYKINIVTIPFVSCAMASTYFLFCMIILAIYNKSLSTALIKNQAIFQIDSFNK
jgi:hypothetical protein